MIVERAFGLVLLVLSFVTYSALNNVGESRLFNLRSVAMCTILFIAVYSFQGIVGLLVMIGYLDRDYHGTFGFSLVLLSEIIVLTGVLKKLKSFGGISISKDSFNCFIYAFVLVSTVNKIAQFLVENYYEFERSLSTGVVMFTTIILLFVGVYLLKVYKDVYHLTESVDLISFLKILCLSFCIYAICGIIKDFYKYTCTLLLVAHITMLVASLHILWDITKKYYAPLKRSKEVID